MTTASASTSTPTPTSTSNSLPIPRWGYTRIRFLRPLLAAPFDLLYRAAIPTTVVLGAEQLRGLDGPVVLAGNHRSFADLPLVQVGLQRSPARRLTRRLVVAAGADGVGWRSPLARYVAFAFGLYPLARGERRAASLDGLVDLARAGNAVLIFPQGQHTRPEEDLSDHSGVHFKPGVAYVAAALDATVVPFGLAGSEEAMPAFLDQYHGRVIAGVPVSLAHVPLAIAFGKPTRRADDESPRAFAVRLEGQCYALARQAQLARDAACQPGSTAPALHPAPVSGTYC